MDTKAVSDHFPALLQQTAATVCAVLNDVLPSASEHWWEELVLPNLSEMQKKAVDRKGVDTLCGLIEISRLIALLEQCERDTEKWLGPDTSPPTTSARRGKLLDSK
jgi:hypothetical protein